MQPLFVSLTFMWLIACFMLSYLDGSQRTALELLDAYSLVRGFIKKIKRREDYVLKFYF